MMEESQKRKYALKHRVSLAPLTMVWIYNALTHRVWIHLIMHSFSSVAQVKKALDVYAPNGVEIVNFDLPGGLQVWMGFCKCVIANRGNHRLLDVKCSRPLRSVSHH